MKKEKLGKRHNEKERKMNKILVKEIKKNDQNN